MLVHNGYGSHSADGTPVSADTAFPVGSVSSLAAVERRERREGRLHAHYCQRDHQEATANSEKHRGEHDHHCQTISLSCSL